MKRAIAIFLLILSITGCASFRAKLPVFQKDKTAGIAISPSYAGPKAKIVVSKATDEIGRGLREMLITALKSSNRFLITEHQELSTAEQVKNLSTQAPDKTTNPAQRDQAKTEDLIINVIVTEFEPQASGGSAGIGGGGGVNRGILGGLLGTSLSKPHLALDIRIVDPSTSGALASRRVLGQAQDMEKAMRICIVEAVRFISQAIPASYYKY